MAVMAVANTSNGVRWTNGKTTGTAESLMALIDQIRRPHALVCEPAFYDELHELRRAFERLLAESGHRLVPITRTSKAALEAVAKRPLSERGLARLYLLAIQATADLGRPPREQDLSTTRSVLEVAHLMDLFDEGSDAVQGAVKIVGPYGSLDGPTRAALGDGQGYRAGVLVAAFRAASVAWNRDEFERLLGLTAGAHGPLTQTIRGWYVERNTVGASFERESALTWSEYRRALRQIFHRVRQQRGAAATA